MTIPRRAAPEGPGSWLRSLRDWFRFGWQPVAIASALCLVLGAAWPALSPSPALLHDTLPAGSTTAVAAPPPGAGQRETDDALTAPGAQATSAPRTERTPPSAHATATLSAGSRLVVGALGISAELLEVGVTDGALEIPEDPGDVGRWRGGAMPGDPNGTVLLSGHVAWNGQRGALWPLASAGVGDVVELIGDDGAATHWFVSTVGRVPREQDHPELFTREGPHRLVVVTCGGPVVDGNYRDLVVVEAVPA